MKNLISKICVGVIFFTNMRYKKLVSAGFEKIRNYKLPNLNDGFLILNNNNNIPERFHLHNV